MAKTKSYISILLSFIIILCASAGISLSASAASYKTLEGKLNYTYAAEVLKLVNEQRAQNGLGKLTMTKTLTDGAMLRAAESAVSFSHTRPNGESCFTAFKWTGTAGENIAYGQKSPQQVVNSWMNSSGHRANILNGSFTCIGIGCFEYGGTLYWAQEFSAGSGSAYSQSGTRNVSVEVATGKGAETTITYKGESEPTTAAAKETTTKKEETTKPAVSKKNRTTRIKRIIRYIFRY